VTGILSPDYLNSRRGISRYSKGVLKAAWPHAGALAVSVDASPVNFWPRLDKPRAKNSPLGRVTRAKEILFAGVRGERAGVVVRA
jgi:hypothetical protein